MPTLSFDGQSFLVDGRRLWLVSGAIHYPRVPHQLWRRRIRAAREAGLNCIETYVFWNAHEPRPGQFDFEGDLDLRRFVQIVGEEGMYCIVRPGPYICAEWDFGGLPAWLHRIEDVRLRQSHPAFLEACARYLGAVMEQIRDLQLTVRSEAPPERAMGGNPAGKPAGGYAGGGGGPIIMMQAENEWMCHNPEQAEGYLREMVRYLRENGCEVPINECNNLWQPVDGAISTWNGARNLTTDMRQLAVVQPEAPRLVTEYWPGWFDQWGAEHSDQVSAELNLSRLAGILAAGAQYNLYMFHGGTNFAFWGGRTVANPACFMTTSYDYDAPLHEAGGRGEKYALTKRISTFASHFGYVLAHLSPEAPPVVVAPRDDEDAADRPLSVISLDGSQGQVIFLVRGENDRAESVNLLLPDGLTLPVPMADERTAWLLRGVNLGGVAQLDYSNLRPWAWVERKLLVLFGPPDAEGLIGIDGTHLQVKVPSAGAADPLVEPHEGLTLVVLNTEQVDHAYLFEGGLALHCAGLDDDGQPLPIGGRGKSSKTTNHAPRIVDLEGRITRQRATSIGRPTAPRLSGWTAASLESTVDGSDEGFTPIDGPTDLAHLDCDYGYGWYRIKVGTSRTARMLAPESGDRLHVYTGGKLQAVLGRGPGAQNDPTELRLGGEVVVLADNLGRFNFGQAMGERKGLFGHIGVVRPAKLPKPKVVRERAADPFAVSGMVMHRRKDGLPITDSLVWTIKPSGRKPMVLDIDGLDLQGTLLVNGEPLALYLGWFSGSQARFVLTPGEQGFTGGQNQIKLSLLDSVEIDLAEVQRRIKLYQVTTPVTDKCDWAFQRWTPPGEEAFETMPRTLAKRPTWFRCTFKAPRTDVPLWIEPRGMTKGQIYLNGHNVGRYFVATPQGKKVPPQTHYYLPEPWLRHDEPNQLLLFDEHGASPAKARLVYNENGPYQ